MDDAALQQRARNILGGKAKVGRGNHLGILIALGDVIEDRALLDAEISRIEPLLTMGGDILLIAMLLEDGKPTPASQLIRLRISAERTWGMVAALPNPVGGDTALRHITNDLAWCAVSEWMRAAKEGERVSDTLLDVITSRLILADVGITNNHQLEVARRARTSGCGSEEFTQWCRSALYRHSLHGEANAHSERPWDGKGRKL